MAAKAATRFVIDGPGGRAEVEHPSAKAVLSKAQGLATVFGEPGTWDVLELPLVSTGEPELLYRVERDDVGIITTRMVNE